MRPEQIRKLDEVYAFMEAMKASTTVPFEVDAALRERLAISSVPVTAVSAKDADSEDLSINEAGAATKVALNDPVGFLSVTLGNTTYYVPYFNA